MYKRLELYTGLSVKEIREDLESKKKVLKWLVDKNVDNIEVIGEVMAQYYLGILDMNKPVPKKRDEE